MRRRCLPDSPKPDSPKLGFRVRVRVSVSANRVSAKRVSANRDWTAEKTMWLDLQVRNSFPPKSPDRHRCLSRDFGGKLLRTCAVAWRKSNGKRPLGTKRSRLRSTLLPPCSQASSSTTDFSLSLSEDCSSWTSTRTGLFLTVRLCFRWDQAAIRLVVYSTCIGYVKYLYCNLIVFSLFVLPLLCCGTTNWSSICADEYCCCWPEFRASESSGQYSFVVHCIRPMSDTLQSWATLSPNFVAQQRRLSDIASCPTFDESSKLLDRNHLYSSAISRSVAELFCFISIVDFCYRLNGWYW